MIHLQTLLPQRIYAIDGLLTPDACSTLVRAVGTPATLVGHSHQQSLEHQPRLTSALWRRLKPLLPIQRCGWTPTGVYHRVRYHRYHPGQYASPHHHISVQHDGACSQLTLLIYLNEAFRGGSTRIGERRLRPHTGSGLLFDSELLHSGEPVFGGSKYVLQAEVMYRPIPPQLLNTDSWVAPPPRMVEGTRS